MEQFNYLVFVLFTRKGAAGSKRSSRLLLSLDCKSGNLTIQFSIKHSETNPSKRVHPLLIEYLLSLIVFHYVSTTINFEPRTPASKARIATRPCNIIRNHLNKGPLSLYVPMCQNQRKHEREVGGRHRIVVVQAFKRRI